LRSRGNGNGSAVVLGDAGKVLPRDEEAQRPKLIETRNTTLERSCRKGALPRGVEAGIDKNDAYTMLFRR